MSSSGCFYPEIRVEYILVFTQLQYTLKNYCLFLGRKYKLKNVVSFKLITLSWRNLYMLTLELAVVNFRTLSKGWEAETRRVRALHLLRIQKLLLLPITCSCKPAVILIKSSTPTTSALRAIRINILQMYSVLLRYLRSMSSFSQ